MSYNGFIVTILTGNMKGNEDGWALPFILFHAAFMFGIPYFIMRRSLRSTKYDIERDIYVKGILLVNVQQFIEIFASARARRSQAKAGNDALKVLLQVSLSSCRLSNIHIIPHKI
jgi:hypothetical protein